MSDKATPRSVLKEEQEKTLKTPRRRYNILSKLLFVSMDMFYGRAKTLPKFKVLEVIARVPYQSWEHVAYIAMTHTYSTPNFARRIFDFVKESREQQDNEQWHLLILEELIHKRNIPEKILLHRILPQVIAFTYYHISWVLYVINPALSYRMNADFEDHAEHEYMEYVTDHPELEGIPFSSDFAEDYGAYENLADVFRRIGLDERHHKESSLERIGRARFS